MKVDRHSKIVELIGKYQIETQEELAEYLKKAGYHVTQATVSRDIRELKLTKAPGKNGRQCYAVMQARQDFGEKYIRILRDCFLSMDMAQNLLIIKTASGMAMAAAEAWNLQRALIYLQEKPEPENRSSSALWRWPLARRHQGT